METSMSKLARQSADAGLDMTNEDLGSHWGKRMAMLMVGQDDAESDAESDADMARLLPASLPPPGGPRETSGPASRDDLESSRVPVHR